MKLPVVCYSLILSTSSYVSHLWSKHLYGTSENALKTQIWIAVSVYVLVAIVPKRLKLEAPLYTLLQVIPVTVFKKTEIQTAFLSISRRIRYCTR
jgi:hypothetical protein